ncbi:MAG: TolC family protein [Thermogutta sp.]
MPAVTPLIDESIRLIRAHLRRHRLITVLCLVSVTLLAGQFCGCHRTAYRRQADTEVATLLQQGQHDPRWKLRDVTVYPKKESRYYDPFCPDNEPMPPDDPVSHQLMHYVDGKKGWPHWHDNGDTYYVESPFWRAYLPRDERGVVVLDRARAVELALTHSREYQQQIENLYLSALNVTAERFRFDVQFFGGHSTFFTTDGRKRAGGARSLLDLDTDAQARKLGATGTELLVGFANSLVWQFSGSDNYASVSLLNFTLMQPLLRAGGRAIVLESLTQAERNLLANIRQMAHYQRGFYLQVVTGTNPGTGPSAGGLSIGSLSPSVSPGRSGVLGLLQTQVQIRNQEQNVQGLEDSYEQLLAAHQADRIDRYQVDLALQSLYNAQSQLLSSRSSYQSQLDSFKVGLGLPPDLPIEISDDLLTQFDFVDPMMLNLQRRTTLLMRALRDPATPEPKDWLDQMRSIFEQTVRQMETVQTDIARLTAVLPQRKLLLQEFYSKPVTEDGQLEGLTNADKAIADLEERYRRILADFDLLMEGKLPPARGEERVPRQPLKQLLENFRQFIEDPDSVTNQKIAELEQQLADLQNQVKAAEDELAKIAEAMTTASQQELSALETKYSQARAQVEILRLRIDSTVRTLHELKTAPKEQIAMQILEPLLLQLSDLSLIQARARLDSVSLVPVDISPEEALGIARENRLDWMNARAALVDQWRQIQIAANRLRSDLDVTFSGDVSTTTDNPFSFDANTGQLRVGFRFDAPFTRLVERNQYRAALIAFQRARRDYLAFEDRIAQSLRDTLRNIRLGQNTFELRRSAVLVSIAQVDLARERLRAPPRPGETSQFGVNTARDLVTALSGLLNAQNAFLGAWVEYEVQRMVLDFQMGTMQLDERGQWIDPGPIRSQTRPEGENVPETLPAPAPKTGVQPLPQISKEAFQESVRKGLVSDGEFGRGGLTGYGQPISRLPDNVARNSSQIGQDAHLGDQVSGQQLSPTLQRLKERLEVHRRSSDSLAGAGQPGVATFPGDAITEQANSEVPINRPVIDHLNDGLYPETIQTSFAPLEKGLPESLLPPIQALLDLENEGITVISDQPE